MPGGTKRKKATGRTAKKSKLATAYKKVQKAKTKRKMRKVVKRAKASRLATTPFLRQPASTLVRFKASHCATYRYGSQMGQAGAAGTNDQSTVFPATGIYINQNDIFDPFGVGGNNSNAPGFDDIGRQYGKYRVIGSKTTYRIRRMGAHIPLTTTSAAHGGALLAPTVQTTGGGVVTSANGIGVGPSTVSNLGGLFDPANADPLMAILVDRNAWQDANSTITDTQIAVDYTTMRQYQHLKGLQWRELKGGAGQKVTIVKKWSERGLSSASNNSDIVQINSGNFHNELGSWTSGGSSPSTKDPMYLYMKPFDGMSQWKNAFSNARFMITIDIEFLVKVTEPRYSFSKP